MKNFPSFNTMISSQDVKEKLEEHYGIKEKQGKEITLAFGMKLVVKEMLPPNSALFIDRKKRIVAVYRDGELLYSAQRKDKRPKKREVSLQKGEEEGVK